MEQTDGCFSLALRFLGFGHMAEREVSTDTLCFLNACVRMSEEKI